MCQAWIETQLGEALHPEFGTGPRAGGGGLQANSPVGMPVRNVEKFHARFAVDERQRGHRA
jgi:hypothetical protein